MLAHTCDGMVCMVFEMNAQMKKDPALLVLLKDLVRQLLHGTSLGTVSHFLPASGASAATMRFLLKLCMRGARCVMRDVAP